MKNIIKEKVLQYKKNCELSILGALYKNIENLYHHDLKLKNFETNVCKIYYTIINQIIIKEKKQEIDDITIGVFLEKFPKLKNKYEEFGGYTTIENMIELINENNIESYILENNKWNAVLMLINFGFNIDLKEINDLSTQEIYDMYEAKLNHVFLAIENEEKAYDICYNIDENMKKWDEGLALGLPYYNSPQLTNETGGSLLGEITLIGGVSGSGKSSFIRNVLIPEVINKDEKLLYMINEQDLSKTQREMIVWIANNIFKEDLQKYKVRNGKYDKEIWKILNKSKEWLKSKSDQILVLPFSTYTKSTTLKTIRKYASLGFKYFVLDTFKLGSDSDVKMIVQQMKTDMIDYYDLIKPKNLNVHLTATFQLNKGSIRERYYTLFNIGESKSIVDTAGCCIMIRRLFDDEYEGGKNELKVYRLEGKYKNTKIQVNLKSDKIYYLLFIVKNREGAANSYQIVVEHDLSKNYYEEIGITNCPVDF